MSNKSNRRFERTDFVRIDDKLELLLMINQSRFDKGQLSIQEEAELMGVNKILTKIEIEQKNTNYILDKWFELKGNDKLEDQEVLQSFDEFISKLMTDNGLV